MIFTRQGVKLSSTIALLLLAILALSSSPALAADKDGLVYLHHRMYDPALGRFISADPAGAGNAYAYGNNSPATMSDPGGQAANCDVCWDLANNSDDANQQLTGTSFRLLAEYAAANRVENDDGSVTYYSSPTYLDEIHDYIKTWSRLQDEIPQAQRASQLHDQMTTRPPFISFSIPEIDIPNPSGYAPTELTPKMDINIPGLSPPPEPSAGQLSEYQSMLSASKNVGADVDKAEALLFDLNTRSRGDAYGFNSDAAGTWDVHNIKFKRDGHGGYMFNGSLRGMDAAHFFAGVSRNGQDDLHAMYETTPGQVAGGALMLAGGGRFIAAKGIPVAGRVAGEVAVGGASSQMPEWFNGYTWAYANQQSYYQTDIAANYYGSWTTQQDGSCRVHTNGC